MASFGSFSQNEKNRKCQGNNNTLYIFIKYQYFCLTHSRYQAKKCPRSKSLKKIDEVRSHIKLYTSCLILRGLFKHQLKDLGFLAQLWLGGQFSDSAECGCWVSGMYNTQGFGIHFQYYCFGLSRINISCLSQHAISQTKRQVVQEVIFQR